MGGAWGGGGAGEVPALPLPASATAAASKDPPNGLEISDIWPPGRAVQKGLHWAGKQVPLIGDADAKPHEAAAASSAPIPLLPSAAESAALEKGDAAPSPKKPTAPGPGSGGLY